MCATLADRIVVNHSNERAKSMGCLTVFSLFLNMVTLLPLPITKRFTKDSIGYVQSGWYGLETIVLLFVFIALKDGEPQILKKSVEEKSVV